ncbi:MAG: hypothetical protein ABF296_13280 [Oceanococcaceae bacterium]
MCCGEGLLSRVLKWYTDPVFLNKVADKRDYFAFDYYYRGLNRDVP